MITQVEILLANPRGFCAGVDRAIDAVKQALSAYGPPVYVKHAVVHNNAVMSDLTALGAIVVEHPSEAPEGAHIVFSAHGSPPEHYEFASARGQHVIDSTCPLVTKVHNEALKYHRDGFQVLYLGHRGHVEAEATRQWAPMRMLDDREPLDLSRIDPEKPLAVLSQTTLSTLDLAENINEIKAQHPEALVRRDICFAVDNRQTGVLELVRRGSEVVIVVGSPESSNSNRMREVAEKSGVRAYLVDRAYDIDPSWLDGVKTVGLSSGASTPEENFRECWQRLMDLEPSSLESVTGSVQEESVVFRAVAL